MPTCSMSWKFLETSTKLRVSYPTLTKREKPYSWICALRVQLNKVIHILTKTSLGMEGSV